MSRYTRSRQARMHDDPREVDAAHDADLGEDLDAQALIAAAVAEAKRYVRRNELRTNSALDAISDWIEKSEMRHADEAKRLASSQERVAVAMRDALDLMTGRLNHIEKLVAEAPAKAFEPIRDALGRLDDRVSVMESQHSEDDRTSKEFSALMESLGKRVTGVVEKIDELADVRDRDNPKVRGERIAGIEAKLGSILQQLSQPTKAGESGASVSRSRADNSPPTSAPPASAPLTSAPPTSAPPASAPPASAPLASAPPASAPPASGPRASVLLRSVTSSGKLDAAVEDIRRKQEELGGHQRQDAAARASGLAEASAGIASLRAELGALAAQLQRLERGQVDPQMLSELLSTTSEVRRLLADPATPRLAKAIEEGVGELTGRIESLATKLVDKEEIAALANAISEINGKLSQPSSAAVESRLDALSAKIDEVMREPLSLVGQHLAELSARLPAAGEAGASHDAIMEIREHLERLADRNDQPTAAEASPAQMSVLAEIKERLDRVSAKLDQAPRGMESAALNGLRGRLEELAQSVERSATKTPETLDRMLRQITAGLQSAKPSEAAPGAVQALEHQIAALAERLGDSQSANAIHALGHSIAKLSDDLVETRTVALKAAETAATDAAAQATSAMRQQRVPGERELQATLVDMNATLERIMDRLSDLEVYARPTASEARLPSISETPVGTAPIWDDAGASDLGRQAGAPASGEEESELSEDQTGYGAFEAAALEAARNAAERAAQRGAGTPAAPAHPTPGDEPLEPGSGRPSPTNPGTVDNRPIDELILGSGEDNRAPTSPEITVSAKGGAMSAQALIAAARRAAAESTPGEKAASDTPERGGAKSPLSSLKLGTGPRRKPILLALIGLITVLSAVGAGRLLLGNWPFSLDRLEPPFLIPAPQGDHSSNLSPQAASAWAKVKKALAAHGAKEDLSLPANDVTGSIAHAPPVPSPSPAGRDAVTPPRKPVEPSVTTAMQSPAPPSESDGLARLKLAANADDPIAEYELASRLYDGNGMGRDPQAAAKLFQRAADQGLAPAQYRLANMYETGMGLPKDLASARAWSEKAADRGNVKAMHNVGVFLAQGVQGKPDYATAVTWFRKAAERNVRDSQFNLGILMARGLGTPRDFKSSYVWFALAARDGDADGAAKRDEVAQRLTNTELDEAKATVANFKPIEPERAANEVDVKDIKWERVTPASGEADASKTNKL
ncbi:MAG: SEL1-like repeat protein [Hyphomicrobiales bacterium]|nr:SEL1-like repeat protein [Hyphomicrobiales bacterium]